MQEPRLGEAINVDEERSIWLNYMSRKDYRGFLGPIKMLHGNQNGNQVLN